MDSTGWRVQVWALVAHLHVDSIDRFHENGPRGRTGSRVRWIKPLGQHRRRFHACHIIEQSRRQPADLAINHRLAAATIRLSRQHIAHVPYDYSETMLSRQVGELKISGRSAIPIHKIGNEEPAYYDIYPHALARVVTLPRLLRNHIEWCSKDSQHVAASI